MAWISTWPRLWSLGLVLWLGFLVDLSDAQHRHRHRPNHRRPSPNRFGPGGPSGPFRRRPPRDHFYDDNYPKNYPQYDSDYPVYGGRPGAFPGGGFGNRPRPDFDYYSDLDDYSLGSQVRPPRLEGANMAEEAKLYAGMTRDLAGMISDVRGTYGDNKLITNLVGDTQMANEGLSNVSEMLSGTASMIERGGSLLEKFRGMFK